MLKQTQLVRFGGLALVAMGLAVSYTNCGAKQTFEMTEEASMNAKGIYSYSTSFTANSQSSQPVDIVWLIDNSGSMSNEAAHVRQNFQAFVSTLENATDMRLALVSSPGNTGTNVSLPRTGANYLQINKTVNSNDALEIAAEMLCPMGQKCGGKNGTGQLHSFLRQNSKKVFVVVTDDQSTMSSSAFHSSFSATYPSNQLALFGFIGIKQSCSIAQRGTVYEELALMTNGDVYDICMADWTSTFKSLATSIIAITQNAVAIPNQHGEIAELLEVYLNDKQIAESDFSFDGKMLKFAPQVLVGLTNANVRILYRIKGEAN